MERDFTGLGQGRRVVAGLHRTVALSASAVHLGERRGNSQVVVEGSTRTTPSSSPASPAPIRVLTRCRNSSRPV